MFNIKNRQTSLKAFNSKNLTQPIPNIQTQIKPIKSDKFDEGVKMYESIKMSQSHKKLLPTISQQRQMKKQIAKQLTNTISKFSHMYQESALKDSDQLIRTACHVLKCFSKTQNNFQQLFVQLNFVFKKFSLVFSDIQLLNKYHSKEGISFRGLCYEMNRVQDGQINKRDEQIKKIKQKYQKLQIQYDIAKGNWKDERLLLLQDVEKYKKMSNVEYVKSLEKKINGMKEEISQKQEDYIKLARQNQATYEEIYSMKEQIQEMLKKQQKLIGQVKILNIAKEKYDIYMATIKDKFQDLIAKMMALKDIIANVETENHNLKTQRMKLVNRAAISFDELTPRPNYTHLLNQKLSKNANMNSTAVIVQKLIRMIPSLTNFQKIGQVFVDNKNNKIPESQKLRQQLSQEIIQSKQKGKKLFW